MPRAAEIIKTLSSQRRYEEAQALRQACDHLLSVRRSYRSLAEASTLRFIALWPRADNGNGSSARMNVVWDGRLRSVLTLCPSTLEHDIEMVLAELEDAGGVASEPHSVHSLVAVPQRDLDSLLAVRRWFYEANGGVRLVIPDPAVGDHHPGTLKRRILAEALNILRP